MYSTILTAVEMVIMNDKVVITCIISIDGID